jgi:hypothetical protein
MFPSLGDLLGQVQGESNGEPASDLFEGVTTQKRQLEAGLAPGEILSTYFVLADGTLVDAYEYGMRNPSTFFVQGADQSGQTVRAVGSAPRAPGSLCKNQECTAVNAKCASGRNTLTYTGALPRTSGGQPGRWPRNYSP